LIHLAFEVGAGQVVEQNFEIGFEQIRPFFLQESKQVLFMFKNPIQTTIQSIFVGDGEVGRQQLIHRAR